MKSRFFIAAVMVFMAETLFALSLGQKEIKMFTNEVVKCAKDVFSYDGEESGNAYVIKLRNRKIRDILIDSATIKCYGLSGEKKRQYSLGDITYDDMSQNVSMVVKCVANENALQDYINIATKRATKAKRVFDDVTIKLKEGKAKLTGKLNMKNLNLPSFIGSEEIMPFDAEVGVKLQDSQIYIEVFNAEFDGSSYPVLLSAMMSWLNPVWDFSVLSEKASIDKLEIKDGKITAFGRLFR